MKFAFSFLFSIFLINSALATNHDLSSNLRDRKYVVKPVNNKGKDTHRILSILSDYFQLYITPNALNKTIDHMRTIKSSSYRRNLASATISYYSVVRLILFGGSTYTLNTQQSYVLLNAVASALNLTNSQCGSVSAENSNWISLVTDATSLNSFTIDARIVISLKQCSIYYNSFAEFSAYYTDSKAPWTNGQRSYDKFCAKSSDCRTATLQTISFSETPPTSSTTNQSIYGSFIFILGIILLSIVALFVIYMIYTRVYLKHRLDRFRALVAQSSSSNSNRSRLGNTITNRIGSLESDNNRTRSENQTRQRQGLFPIRAPVRGVSIVDLDSIPVEIAPSSITLYPGDFNVPFTDSPRTLAKKKAVLAVGVSIVDLAEFDHTQENSPTRDDSTGSDIDHELSSIQDESAGNTNIVRSATTSPILPLLNLLPASPTFELIESWFGVTEAGQNANSSVSDSDEERE